MMREHAELTPGVWRILARNFGDAIHLLRMEEPLDGLDGSQWSTLLWVVTSWTRGDMSPSQRDLARLSGLSTRTIRRSLLALEQIELLHGVRENGLATELGVGPRLVPLLRDFAFCRDPKIWTRTTPDKSAYTPAPTPDNRSHRDTETPDSGTHERGLTPDSGTDAAGPTPARGTYGGGSTVDTVAAVEGSLSSLIKKNKDLTSSFSSERGPTPANPSATPHVDAATARRLALDALAARFVRANPGIPLPRACDAGDVKLVEACTASATWDVETLRQAHLDAIDGAFEKAPPDRPPTPKYIWGQLRFFLAHASIGRAKRLQAAPPSKPKKPRPPEEPPASSAWLAQHMREACARLETIPAISMPKSPLRFAEDTQ